MVGWVTRNKPTDVMLKGETARETMRLLMPSSAERAVETVARQRGEVISLRAAEFKWIITRARNEIDPNEARALIKSVLERNLSPDEAKLLVPDLASIVRNRKKEDILFVQDTLLVLTVCHLIIGNDKIISGWLRSRDKELKVHVIDAFANAITEGFISPRQLVALEAPLRQLVEHSKDSNSIQIQFYRYVLSLIEGEKIAGTSSAE